MKDDLVAKEREIVWGSEISPYRRSEIDTGVLELSKPDSSGTVPYIWSPTWTNMDIEDIESLWDRRTPFLPPSFGPSAAVCRETHQPLADFIFGL